MTAESPRFTTSFISRSKSAFEEGAWVLEALKWLRSASVSSSHSPWTPLQVQVSTHFWKSRALFLDLFSSKSTDFAKNGQTACLYFFPLAEPSGPGSRSLNFSFQSPQTLRVYDGPYFCHQGFDRSRSSYQNF